ncbi:MAG: glycosyltransferase family 39 protein [Anaerolineales bacterium]
MPKIRYMETLLYALAGGTLIALARLIPAGSFFIKGRAGICSSLLTGYGGLLLLCAFVSFLYARRGRSLGAALAAQARATFGTVREIGGWLAGRCDRRGDVFALLAATLLGVGARAFFMSQPMRLDEAYTFLYYLSQGRDPFYYNVPNNHVLHTLLAKLAVLVGGAQPVAIRFPAFVAGILCIPAMFLVVRAFHKNGGVLAALAMAVFPYMILYSTMARGYSLIVLLTLLLVLAGRFYLEKPSLAGCILIAVISALGLFTIPTMAFVLAGVYLWLALALWIKSRNALALCRDCVFPVLAITAILTVIFYTPTLISSNGAGAIFSNKYVDATSWKDFWVHVSPHFQQVVSDFFRDVPELAKYAGVLLALIGLALSAARREWTTFLLIPAIFAGGLAVFFAKQAIPFVRTWIYLIPFFLLFADLGYTSLTQKLQPRLKLASDSLILIAGLVFVGALISTNAIAKYPDTGAFPEAATVAQYLKPLLTGGEFIAVKDKANYPLYYYLCVDNAPPQNKDLDPKTVKRYFVVQNSWYTLGDLTKQPAEPIFTFGDATVYTSVSKTEPIWQGFVFECRDTHP